MTLVLVLHKCYLSLLLVVCYNIVECRIIDKNNYKYGLNFQVFQHPSTYYLF